MANRYRVLWVFPLLVTAPCTKSTSYWDDGQSQVGMDASSFAGYAVSTEQARFELGIKPSCAWGENSALVVRYGPGIHAGRCVSLAHCIRVTPVASDLKLHGCPWSREPASR